MKNIILAIFLITTTQIFSQELSKYIIDERVSIDIPEVLQVTDTLRQKIVKSVSGDNIILVSKFTQEVTIGKLENDNQLFKFYEGIQKGVLKSVNGKLIDQKITESNGIKFLDLTVEANIAGELKIYESVIFLFNNYLYSIQFIKPLETKDDFEILENRILSSLILK